jgi:pimeloyl-ACP methyl ester carboxylesterase/DNA-binding winged helix-turn-helix (wHTH) protein
MRFFQRVLELNSQPGGRLTVPVQNNFTFGRFHLDAGERTLLDGATPVTLAPKVFDTLLMLVRNQGRVLSKQRMLNEIWEGSFVEENNLAQNISLLRRILGETKEQKYIETVPKFGYRFVADVIADEPGATVEIIERTRARIYVDEGASTGPASLYGTERPAITSAPPAVAALRPETRYVQNGDVNIAYQVVGDGEIDIVFVMGWISHMEYFWKHHLFADFLGRLASFSRLILFDKRGTGLSDRVPIDKLPTLEQRMEDVHAVMDAVGSRRAVLVGVSEGGPMCSLFAATYPERTTALVMIGTYAKRTFDTDYPWAPTADQREAFFELMRNEWGTAVGIEERAPSMANDPEFREWWATYLRMGASPGAAVALTEMNAEIDVRNVLPSIRVPTLVMHRSGDLCLKVEEGRYVASKIPGCRYVEFEGSDHLPFVGNQDEILDEIERFVTGSQESLDHDRVLATVMNILIIDPKEEADRRGVEDWRNLLKGAHIFVRRRLQLFKGREIAFGENGVVATFDGPARAIRCAESIAGSAAELGVRVKAGLHTGECDVTAGVYRGFAVDLAKQIAEAADPGTIVVSRTVKDLVAGSGLKFKESGLRTFDGIEGEWRLFDVVR